MYRAPTPADFEMQELANQALLDLAETGYRFDLPPVEDPNRAERVIETAQVINRIATAAQSFAFIQDAPERQYLPAAPGHMPEPVTSAIMGFVDDTLLEERLNMPLLVAMSKQMGFETGTVSETKITDIERHYLNAPARIQNELGAALAGISDGVTLGDGWFLEGKDLASGAPLTSSSLKSKTAEHMIVPELPVPPVTPTPEFPQAATACRLCSAFQTFTWARGKLWTMLTTFTQISTGP